jgi:signal transduction histidine kinase
MVSVGSARLRVVAMVDITELRRIENELRDLNTELEVRVAGRTQALETLNEELSVTVVNLRQTQAELVRAEKMAALGGLVAGVAHELNTPLGNGLLAVTSMGDVVREFRAQMQAGLKRSALEGFLLTVEQGADIATRNLQRAADLVSSFKQVAVDQTSSQRRSFELAEVVNEMVTSLAPSLRRTPYRLVVDVASSGLRLDSYPGPLGQVLGNLINNAVQHGFDGRAHGVIRVAGMRAPDGAIVLSVADDGKGIPAALVPRIFDPFVTTKMGRGGTGLGLNIAYNAVVNLLGGTLSVTSVEGEGAVFEVRLAETAPLSGGDSHLA